MDSAPQMAAMATAETKDDPVLLGSHTIEPDPVSTGPEPVSKLQAVKSLIHRGGCKQFDIDELIASLGPNEQHLADTLREFDHDGDGSISISELVRIGETRQQHEKKIRNLKNTVLIVIGFSFLFCAVMLGLMIAANEASKEDKPDDDGNLKTISGKYISTEDTMSSVDLVDLAGVAPEDLRSLDNILLTTDTGSKRYYTITGFESFSNTHLELFSARGDRISVRDGSVEVLNSDGSTTAVARRKLLANSGDCQLRTGKYSTMDNWQADTVTAIYCPGFAEYCDCGGDCHNHPEWCSCPEAQACCASEHGHSHLDSDTDSDTVTEIHCPGFAEYCDCGGDCHNHPEWCSCPDAQACCASAHGHSHLDSDSDTDTD